MRFDINSWYGITVSHGEKIGPRRWRAKAFIFRRDTQQRVGGEFYGLGGAMTTADDDALQKAKIELYKLGEPEDWSGPDGGFKK